VPRCSWATGPAYQYRSKPADLFNIAQMRRKLGRYGEAASSYREFLGLADKAARRRDAEGD